MPTYTVLVAPDPVAGGYTVTVPALPGCVSRGKTMDECLSNAERAILGYLDDPSVPGAPEPEHITLSVLALATRDDDPQLQSPPFTHARGDGSAAAGEGG